MAKIYTTLAGNKIRDRYAYSFGVYESAVEDALKLLDFKDIDGAIKELRSAFPFVEHIFNQEGEEE